MIYQLLLGCDASLEVMVQELELLWEHGILVNGIRWRVAMINGIWDGKGFEQVIKLYIYITLIYYFNNFKYYKGY